MLRFTIRDLLWLTLVVAMGLGWFLRERELRAEATHANERADKLRGMAGALEHVMNDFAWEAKWGTAEVILDCQLDPFARVVVPLNRYKPSASE